jgi:hypothetical protein
LDKRIGVRLLSTQQLRQPGNAGSDPPRLIACEQTGSCAPAGIILAIDKRQRPPAVVADNEARSRFFDRPGWWEAARARHHVLPVNRRAASNITKAPGTTKSRAN